MKEYDAIVIGSGCGAIIVDEARGHGQKVALVDKGPLGGTCLNLGCIPSKMLIYVADRIVEVQESQRLDFTAEIKEINFGAIMDRMRKSITEGLNWTKEDLKQTEGLDYYEGTGHFVSDYTIEVNGETIKGKKVFIAAGSRPAIPPIKGLEQIDFLTSESVLQLRERPDSLIIIGGGYIAVEYGHFFAAMGTHVTILEMTDRLALAEEPEMSKLLQQELSRRMSIFTDTQVEEFKSSGDLAVVVAKDKKNGVKREFTAQRILIATGRRSNADLLKPENSGINLDKRGFIQVDEFLETSKKNIFAVGDVNGKQMFTHAANREASIAIDNALHNSGLKMDYSAAPHAVYSHPQIAAVGLTEAEAKKDHSILVGKMKYFHIAKGEAMMETEGFAKAIVEKDSGKILGFHIIGPNAPELIQEVTNAMASGTNIEGIAQGMHIHPSLSELVPRTIDELEEPS
ncbi:MAG: dihydrolipoyl dehydrogenase [Dehalococcoidales bacterium]|nr:dihydrolipoyl dehydrogenase [Dehalococcoidales bacterium]